MKASGLHSKIQNFRNLAEETGKNTMIKEEHKAAEQSHEGTFRDGGYYLSSGIYFSAVTRTSIIIYPYCSDTLGMGKVTVTTRFCPSTVVRAPDSQK